MGPGKGLLRRESRRPPAPVRDRPSRPRSPNRPPLSLGLPVAGGHRSDEGHPERRQGRWRNPRAATTSPPGSFSFFKASRYASGSGLVAFTSSFATTNSNAFASPDAPSTASTLPRQVVVTTPSGPARQPIDQGGDSGVDPRRVGQESERPAPACGRPTPRRSPRRASVGRRPGPRTPGRRSRRPWRSSRPARSSPSRRRSAARRRHGRSRCRRSPHRNRTARRAGWHCIPWKRH